MGKYCVICQKGVMSGNNVSHAHNKTRRKWAPNIQKARVLIDGTPKVINVCTRCLRSGKVQRVF